MSLIIALLTSWFTRNFNINVNHYRTIAPNVSEEDVIDLTSERDVIDVERAESAATSVS